MAGAAETSPTSKAVAVGAPAAGESNKPRLTLSGKLSTAAAREGLFARLAPVSIEQLSLAIRLLLPKLADSVDTDQLDAALLKVKCEELRLKAHGDEVGMQHDIAQAEKKQAQYTVFLSLCSIGAVFGLGRIFSSGEGANSQFGWAVVQQGSQLVSQLGDVASRRGLGLPKTWDEEKGWLDSLASWTGSGQQYRLNQLRLAQGEKRLVQEAEEQLVQIIGGAVQQLQELGRDQRRLTSQMAQGTNQAMAGS